MGRDRTTIEELELTGSSSNLARYRNREKSENVPLTAEQKDEVAQLDALIQQCMKACRKGCTVGGKPNPAFEQLARVVKTREQLLKGRRAPKTKTAKELADSFKDLMAN